MKTDYYTYAYLRNDNTPWYIGKGKGRRAYQKHDHFSPPPKNRIILLKQNLTEQEAFRHEIYMISVFGRKDLGTGILRNKTSGEDSPPIFKKHTQESKQKISQKLKGVYTRPPMTEIEKNNRSIKNKLNNVLPPLNSVGFKFISPEGKLISGKNIKEFSIKFNLNVNSLYDMRRGKLKQYKGWRLG